MQLTVVNKKTEKTMSTLRAAAHRRRNYVRFPDQPFMDDPDGIKLVVTTRTPEAINVSTISELLEVQQRVMKIAMEDVYKNPNTVEKARHPPARKRPRCSFAADADLLVAGTLATLDSTAYMHDPHQQAYIVQVPKTTKAYTTAAHDGDSDDDLIVEADDASDDELPTNIKRLADETDWPLYPMQSSRYPHLQLLNLRRLAACESSRGIALPTTQQIEQLVEASLFYDAPVVVANLSATSLCAFALYPEFIRRLRDYSTSEQRRRVGVMQHNTTKVCLSKVVTAEKLVHIYRHLLGDKQAGPVIWLHILPLTG